MSDPTNPYYGHRYPAEIISHAVWLYFRFTLSLRDIDELLAARGIFVTYETIRQWTLKFGQRFANELRRRQPRRGDKWHLDEMVITMNGKHHYRLAGRGSRRLHPRYSGQSRRNAKAAKRFFRKLLKGLHYVPRALITDKLKSYAAAKKTVMPGVEHRQQKRLNNRAERSHQTPRASRSARCGGSNHPARRNGSCPPTAPSTISSTCVAIAYRPPNIGLLVKTPSIRGHR